MRRFIQALLTVGWLIGTVYMVYLMFVMGVFRGFEYTLIIAYMTFLAAIGMGSILWWKE